MVVFQGKPLLEVLGQFPLGMKRGQIRGAGLLPGAGMPLVVGIEQVTACLVRKKRCWRLSVMPRSTEDTQPPPRRRPSMALTRSLVAPRMDARLATLARGIRTVMRSNRRCS